MVYFLFGDLTLLEKYGLFDFLMWLIEHPAVGLVVQVLMPAVTVLLYAASYRLSVNLAGKEREQDE